MKEEYKLWQNKWREIMGLPTNVDKDHYCDFDLHFNIWELEKEKFDQLFTLFPKGKEIAERAYRLKWGDIEEFTQKLSQEELMAEARASIDIMQQIFPVDELADPTFTFLSGDEDERIKSLTRTEPLSLSIDDRFSNLVKKAHGMVGYNSYFFLREPMYRLSSRYQPCNWILWTLTDIDDKNPYTPLLKLYYNDCDAVLTGDGVLLFKVIAD